jgi:predicted nucleotidyltransferase
MAMSLSRDLREFVECLNSKEVEYRIAGALAVSWYGFPRYSADVDLFVNPSEENAERIVAALRDFGFANLEVTREVLCLPDRVVQFGREPNRIDLMTGISGVAFEEAWPRRESGQIDGVPVKFIGRADLLRNKAAAGRAKDRVNLAELEKQEPRE